MVISDAGLAIVKECEGLRLHAYPDPGTGGEPWTIGYGHTKGVKPGDRITEQQALWYLRDDIADAERCVSEKVLATLTQNRFDALCSFVYNVGCGAFSKSTLLRKLNAGDPTASDEFGRWVKAGGKTLPGLVRRRALERDLFAKGSP